MNIERTIEQMRRDDREFITPETVAQFAGCTEGAAALVLYQRALEKAAALERRVDLLTAYVVEALERVEVEDHITAELILSNALEAAKR